MNGRDFRIFIRPDVFDGDVQPHLAWRGEDHSVIGTRGPGERKLEVDTRRIRDQIVALDRQIEQVREVHSVHGSIDVLLKAVLTRVMTKPQEEIIRMGPIELNLTSYTLKVAGKNVPLTSKELDLLYVFLSSPNRVLSRPYLIERVWGYNYFGSPRTVDVHVRRLREKLCKAAKFITTVPCVGYKLIPPGSEV